MSANKPASDRSLKSDLERVDANEIKPDEYNELPELTEEMFKRGTVKRAGRSVRKNGYVDVGVAEVD